MDTPVPVVVVVGSGATVVPAVVVGFGGFVLLDDEVVPPDDVVRPPDAVVVLPDGEVVPPGDVDVERVVDTVVKL